VVLHQSTVLRSMISSSRPIARAFALALGILLVSESCYLDFKRGGGPRPTLGRYNGREGGPRSERTLADGFGPKIVEDKRPPTRLIARDRTSCVVSKNKYDATALGTTVWCTWIDMDR
jgi:hypothetical protein